MFVKIGRVLCLLAVVCVTSLFGVAPASAATTTSLFTDGFEGGNMAAWTTVRGVVAETSGDAFSGLYAAQATSTGTAVYARKNITSTTFLDYSLKFKLVKLSTTTVNVMAARPTTGAPLASVFLNTKSKLALKIGGVTTTSQTVVTAGSWHTLRLHIEVSGSASTTQVWFDTASTAAAASTASLSTPVTKIEMGDPALQHTFDMRFDEVSVQGASAPPDTTPPSAPGTLTAAAVSDHQVNLSWGAATDDVGVTAYDVLRDGAPLASVSGVTYSDTSAVASQTYTYQVQARDAAGNVGPPSNSATATTPPATGGGSARIAAAGDIACAPGGLVTATTCQQTATSDLLVGGQFDRILALGDNQYVNGALSDYLASYDPSWGRAISNTAPVPGNHEYVTTGATGYYSYFGSAAGDPQKGYYSFDVGAWHVIALNSNCAAIAPDGCAAGTAQEQWLKADLAAHPNACTLAYWHHPLASSGGHGGTAAVRPFWDDLYAAHADVVLNGHSHDYERFVPMNPTKASDPANGIREFVVGTGGEDHDLASSTPAATSEIRNFDSFGVIELTLSATTYSWNFVPAAGYTFQDSGTGTCH